MLRARARMTHEERAQPHAHDVDVVTPGIARRVGEIDAMWSC